MNRALIVGINHYTWAPLRGPINDALAMASVLSKHEDGSNNFDCRVLLSTPQNAQRVNQLYAEHRAPLNFATPTVFEGASSEEYLLEEELITEEAKNFEEQRKSAGLRNVKVSSKEVSTDLLMEQTTKLFQHDADTVLFYFSGHGGNTTIGGTLVTQDATEHMPGVSLLHLLNLATEALREGRARQVIMMLDCCHSGHLGNFLLAGHETAILSKGISILTSSMPLQYSVERNGAGLFTQIMVEGLKGAAQDLLGEVHLSALYNYADRLLNAWEQRPVVKIHTDRMTILRKNKPELNIESIRRLPAYFPEEDYVYPLSPENEDTTYEQGNQNAHKNAQKEPFKYMIQDFKELQSYARKGLVEPVDEEHMYFAAMNSTGCQLTTLGKMYRKLVMEGYV